MSSGLFCSSNNLGEGMLCGLQFLMCAPWISNAAKRSQVVSKKYKKVGASRARIVWKILVFRKIKLVSSWQDFSEPLLC